MNWSTKLSILLMIGSVSNSPLNWICKMGYIIPVFFYHTWWFVLRLSICLLKACTQNCLQMNTTASSSFLNLGWSLETLSTRLSPTLWPISSSCLIVSVSVGCDWKLNEIYNITSHQLTWIIFVTLFFASSSGPLRGGRKGLEMRPSIFESYPVDNSLYQFLVYLACRRPALRVGTRRRTDWRLRR